MLLCVIVLSCALRIHVHAAEIDEQTYDVTSPHVLIHQIYGCGAKGSGYVSHSFIELYNPTDSEVDLHGWSLQYRSSEDGPQNDEWAKLELSGKIPTHGSYLIRCQEDTTATAPNWSIESFDQEWDVQIHNKGVSVVLLSGTEGIPSDSEVFDNETKRPVVQNYVDMLAVSGNDLDKDSAQMAPSYEGTVNPDQSKKKGIRRNHFQDTDNNGIDALAVDYSNADAISEIRPHSSVEGAWGQELQQPVDEKETAFAAIEQLVQSIPKYYENYCTADTVEQVSGVKAKLSGIDRDKVTVEELNSLRSEFEDVISNLQYKSDTTVPQVYLTTDNGSGESYGNTLTKSIGYVPTHITLVDTSGETLVDDTSGQIKIRGNSTANGEKKPYNIKFNKKQDLFGFGQSKNWCLLADCYDPTLMRNAIALNLAKELGLSATPDYHRVEIWVDGKYQGLYLLTEKIAADKNRVDIDTQNGDFLVESDTESRIEEKNVYLKTNNIKKLFRLREPEDQNAVSDVTRVMDIFENTLVAGDYEKIKNIIDEDSFAKYYLVNEYMKVVDFASFSVFFYYKDGKIYAGPEWDCDYSCGNVDPKLYSVYYYGSDSASAANSHYYIYLMRYPEFRIAVQKTFEANKYIFENMMAENGWIDQQYDIYRDAIDRNFSDGAWIVNKKYISAERQPDDTYEENLKYLKTWLLNRYKWMNNYIEQRTRTGIFQGEDGWYYYEDGEKTAAGLINLDAKYYYVDESGKIATGDVQVVKANDLIIPGSTDQFPQGSYHFNSVGWMETYPKVVLPSKEPSDETLSDETPKSEKTTDTIKSEESKQNDQAEDSDKKVDEKQHNTTDNGANATQAAGVGTLLTNKEGKYVVTVSGKNPEVEFKSLTNKKTTRVTIPETIRKDGVTYAVTSIAENAFKNNKKIKSVTIGKNVKTIGKNAFRNCSKLTSITIPKNVKTIKNNAFYGCKKLKKVTIKSTGIKTIGKNAFKGVKPDATVKCPKQQRKKYRTKLRKAGLPKKAKVKG